MPVCAYFIHINFIFNFSSFQNNLNLSGYLFTKQIFFKWLFVSNALPYVSSNRKIYNK